MTWEGVCSGWGRWYCSERAVALFFLDFDAVFVGEFEVLFVAFFAHG